MVPVPPVFGGRPCIAVARAMDGLPFDDDNGGRYGSKQHQRWRDVGAHLWRSKRTQGARENGGVKIHIAVPLRVRGRQ